MMEKDIEQSLRLLVELKGGLCLKWVCPGWSGVPDRIVLLPGGRIYFIELKQPNGRISKLQGVWQRRITARGFQHRFIWNEEDLLQFEEELG